MLTFIKNVNNNFIFIDIDINLSKNILFMLHIVLKVNYYTYS